MRAPLPAPPLVPCPGLTPWIMHVTAVVPSGMPRAAACRKKAASVRWKASTAAPSSTPEEEKLSLPLSASPRARVSSRSRLLTRCAWAHAAARLPPWPSYTAKLHAHARATREQIEPSDTGNVGADGVDSVRAPPW